MPHPTAQIKVLRGNVSLMQEDYQFIACWQHFFDIESWRTLTFRLPDLAGKCFGTLSHCGTGILPVFVNRGTGILPVFVNRGTGIVPVFVNRGTGIVPVFVNRGTGILPVLSRNISWAGRPCHQECARSFSEEQSQSSVEVRKSEVWS
jgi:hypothetical protein